MSLFIFRTPFRISFFGGGTDYPAWYLREGGAVLSTAIDKYCYITARYLPPFFPTTHRIVWSHIETISSIAEILHPAVREALGSGPIKLLSGRSAADSLMGGRTPSMSDLFWLSERQLAKIEPHFPLSHGVPRVDDRRVISGIVHVIRNGLRWRDAPPVYGPHKTLYNRFVRWSRLGVFSRIFAALTGEAGPPDRLMIDATHLKAHRTAASLHKKGLFPDVSDAQKAG